MNPELEKQLYDKYPKIFRDAGKSPQESCMAFGLEVGDGWYSIIDTLCEALTYTYTTSVKIDEGDAKLLGIEGYKWNDGLVTYHFNVKPPQVIAEQIKEKFGSLRFYYHLEYDEQNTKLVETGKYPDLVEVNKRYADYLDGVVHFADIASARICEVSGDIGVMHTRGGWMKVLNEELAKQSPNLKGYAPYINKNVD